MTERVFLHVGSPKSGTTYLQQVMRGHRERFATHGVLCGFEHVELVHATMVLRGDRRLGGLPPRARGAWDRVVAQVSGWRGDTAVLSYELLSNLTAEQAARAVADLGSVEVHVVITSRDLGRAVAGAWQERLKFGLTEPLASWEPPGETVVGSEWGWRTLDPSSVASRWSAAVPAHRVHLVTAPAGAGAGLLWGRFAEACGLGQIPVDPVVDRANESLGPAAAEVLRRANPLLGEVLRSGRDHAVWSRDLLANRVLAHLTREPLRLSPSQQTQAQDRYDVAAAAVREAGDRVHGQLEDLAPGEASGRAPGEVGEAELLDTALRALAGVVREVRNDAVEVGPAAAPGPDRRVDDEQDGPREVPGLAARAKGSARATARLVAGVASRPVLERNRQLHRRIDELEALLDDRRRLQQRMAMLTDLVTELLLPADGLDDASVDELLSRYRRTTL